MSGRRMWVGIVVALLVTAWAAGALAQDQGRRRGRNRAANRAQWQERYYQRIRENLGATEEEWQVLKPLVEKVSTLRRQARGMLFRRRRRAPEGAEGQAQELSPIEKAVQDLRTLLEDPAAKVEDIQARLKALRDARAKILEELAKAQKALQEAVTPRQEALLVLSGLLD